MTQNVYLMDAGYHPKYHMKNTFARIAVALVGITTTKA